MPFGSWIVLSPRLAEDLSAGLGELSAEEKAKLLAALQGGSGGGARKPVVGGNWKCNPASMKDLDGLIANINACDTAACDVYVCPSLLHTPYCSDKFTNGAMVTPQNCNFKGCGAYTGEMAV